MLTEIMCNSVIEWRDEVLEITAVERVLWISPDSTCAVVIDIGSLKNWPTTRTLAEIQSAFKDGTARKLPLDPYGRFSNPSHDYVEKHREIRDKAWTAIGSIVDIEPDIYDPLLRGAIVREICDGHGIHKKVVYDYLRRYWIRGKTINALLPEYHNSGAPGMERISSGTSKRGRPPAVTRSAPNLMGINVTDNDLKNIRIAIHEIYLKSEKPSLTFTYEEMKRRYYNQSVTFVDGKPVPILLSDNEILSFNQFRYWVGKELESVKNALNPRIGRRDYALKKRPLLGNATKRAFGPGSTFEIDATIANVYLVSKFDRNRIIGRPVVYMVKDVFSRMIAGLYVGLEGPSWLGAMMALENATCDKVSFCAEYGIEIEEEDWPCHYLPKTITADRGEMEGKNADNMILSLGIRIDNTPPYRADLKGIIEQHFHIYPGRIGPFVPGGFDKQLLHERGEPDYRTRARMTINGFTKIMIYSILEHNKRELKAYPLDIDMTHDQVPPIPLELWNWGIVNCSGQLQERPREVVRLNLMPQGEASVSRQGILFSPDQGKQKRVLRYSCEEALQEGWYERALKGRFRVRVAFDPRNATAIYIPTNNGSDYIRCELLDHFERFRDACMEEVMDQLFREDVQSSQRKSEQGQNTATYATLRKQTMQDEVQLTEDVLDPTQSVASRTKDIRGNRREEKERVRPEEAWEIGKRAASTAPAEVLKLETHQGESKTSESVDPIMEMIMKQAESRRQK